MITKQQKKLLGKQSLRNVVISGIFAFILALIIKIFGAYTELNALACVMYFFFYAAYLQLNDIKQILVENGNQNE